MLDAARGYANAVIARRCQVSTDTARKWRGRFAVHGLDGLGDRPRSGRPPTFTPVQVAEVTALACQLPKWGGRAAGPVELPGAGPPGRPDGVAESISASTVRRWLAADAIKPWQYRSWIFGAVSPSART